MRVGRRHESGTPPAGEYFCRNEKGSTPRDTPGLAIPSIPRGFTPGGHRDSSLYRWVRMMLNV